MDVFFKGSYILELKERGWKVRLSGQSTLNQKLKPESLRRVHYI